MKRMTVILVVGLALAGIVAAVVLGRRDSLA